MTTWKRVERDVCRLFGGERRGPQGISESDCVQTEEAVQIKHTSSTTGGIRGKWIDQARLQGDQESKPWVLVVHPKGARVTDSVALVSLQYLLALKANAC